jgi:hypothetical protein
VNFNFRIFQDISRHSQDIFKIDSR